MSQTAAEHWLKISERRANEIKDLAGRLLSLVSSVGEDREENIQAAIAELEDKIEALAKHYEPGPVPIALSNFRKALADWHGLKTHNPFFFKLINAYEQLDKITEYADHTPTVSLDAIIERYRSDEKLEEKLAELVKKLGELTAIADAKLSRQVATELKRLLEEIERRQEKSLTDLVAWLDFGMKGLARLGDMGLGAPFASIAYDCAKLALASKLRIRALFDKAQKEFRLELKLPTLEEAANQTGEIESEADIRKYLPAAKKNS